MISYLSPTGQLHLARHTYLRLFGIALSLSPKSSCIFLV